MTDFHSLLASLKRPRLLVRAARHGLEDYDRCRDLKRLFAGAAPAPETAVARLMGTEEALEEARRDGAAGYSVARHVEVMIALLGELRLVARHAAV